MLSPSELAVAFGIAAALGWGLANVLYRSSGQRVGALRAMFFFQLPGAIALSAWLAVDHASVAATIHDAPPWGWPAAVAAAAIILAGSAAFIRALTVGRLTLVSPVAASYAAVTVALSLAHGNAIGLLSALGMATAVFGVALASSPSGRPGPSSSRAGLGWAVLAATGFGAGFWVQGTFAVPALGHILPVWTYYVLGLGVVSVIARVRGRSLSPPGPEHRGVVIGAGLLGMVGYTTFTAGLGTGHVAVVTVLSSLAAAVTVLVARFALREHLARHQWLGVGAILVGIGLINVGR